MKAINATTIGNLIGYKIGGSFEDYSDNGDIGFEILKTARCGQCNT